MRRRNILMALLRRQNRGNDSRDVSRSFSYIGLYLYYMLPYHKQNRIVPRKSRLSTNKDIYYGIT